MGSRRRGGSKLKTTILLLMVPIGFVVVFNLFWLGFSTTRVAIAGRGLASVKIRINDETIDLGNMRRGESRFMFLPKHDIATYTITYEAERHTVTACQVEVMNTKQHVEARLYDNRESTCTVTEPLFSDLMVTKFF